MKKEKILRALVTGSIITVLGLLFLWRTRDVSPEKTAGFVSEEESPDPGEISGTLVAYITGAVIEPGVYEAEPGDRISVLVEKAGGFTEDADVTACNLAEPVADGMHVHIPFVSEEIPAASDGRININTATAEELVRLPGIGTSKAEAIIDFREKNGGFSDVTDIKKVSGIGDALFERIRDRLRVR